MSSAAEQLLQTALARDLALDSGKISKTDIVQSVGAVGSTEKVPSERAVRGALTFMLKGVVSAVEPTSPTADLLWFDLMTMTIKVWSTDVNAWLSFAGAGSAVTFGGEEVTFGGGDVTF